MVGRTRYVLNNEELGVGICPKSPNSPGFKFSIRYSRWVAHLHITLQYSCTMSCTIQSAVVLEYCTIGKYKNTDKWILSDFSLTTFLCGPRRADSINDVLREGPRSQGASCVVCSSGVPPYDFLNLYDISNIRFCISFP